jgi:hypothetical protein
METTSDLPVELWDDVSRDLDPDDLSAVRLVSRRAAKSTTLPWAEDKDFSKPIDVLMTAQGLQALLELTKLTSFIENVTTINILYHSIPELQNLKDVSQGPSEPNRNQTLELSRAQRLALRQSIIPAQQNFETSGRSLEVCCEIFKALLQAEKLETICIGSRAHNDPLTSKRCLGLPGLEDEMQLTQSQKDRYLQLLGLESPQPAFRRTLNIALDALGRVKFSKPVIQLAILFPQQPAIGSNERSQDVAPKFWGPLKQLQQCLRNITIRDTDFHETGQENSGVWLYQCIQAISGSSVRTLTIFGCAKQVCSYCPLLVRTLSSAQFPHLQTLSLYSLVTDIKVLTTLLRKHKSHFMWLKFDIVTLSDGSWKEVLRAFLDMPKLREVQLNNLWQEASKDSLPQNPSCNSEPVDETRAVFWGTIMGGPSGGTYFTILDDIRLWLHSTTMRWPLLEWPRASRVCLNHLPDWKNAGRK